MNKKIILFLGLIVIVISSNAQAPNAIPYQGVARNAAGNIIASQAISLRISIRDFNPAGTIVFRETHNTTTNSLGLFNINIGLGTPVTGTLAAVNWGVASKFLQVELDPAGGTSYLNMGTTQLNSVPYALFAANSANLPTGTASGNTMHWNGSAWVADNGIFNNGTNVGIGTGAFPPIARLDVVGSGSSSATNNLVLRNNIGDTLLRMRNDSRMGINYNGSSYGRTVNIGGTGINFYTANEAAFGGAVFPTDTSLVLWSNSGANNYLVLQPSWGNTGVGTYSPNAKFHVNGSMLIGSNSNTIATGYSLSVAGKIMCTEITATPVASWPDYVFSKKYNLLSLENLERFVKKEKHLPNIPSAKEINKSGISLADMTTKMIEKIEELTLYIIEINKINNELSERVKKLEKQIINE